MASGGRDDGGVDQQLQIVRERVQDVVSIPIFDECDLALEKRILC
jgi:hypothetical protein